MYTRVDMYAHGDFADFLEEFAKFDMVVPSDGEYIEYHIPLPLDGLKFVVDPKISIDTMQYDGEDPEFFIKSQSGDVTRVHDTPVNEENWDVKFENVIRDEVSQWRSHVL